MSNTVTITLVETAAGVDRASSSKAFESAVDKFIAERETQESTIAGAVGAYFDSHKNEPIKMPALVHGALQHLNVQPSNYGSLEKLVKAYVRSNSQSVKLPDGKVEERPQSLFVIAKGKGGGVTRRSDLPVETPETASTETETDSDEDSE